MIPICPKLGFKPGKAKPLFGTTNCCGRPEAGLPNPLPAKFAMVAPAEMAQSTVEQPKLRFGRSDRGCRCCEVEGLSGSHDVRVVHQDVVDIGVVHVVDRQKQRAGELLLNAGVDLRGIGSFVVRVEQAAEVLKSGRRSDR